MTANEPTNVSGDRVQTMSLLDFGIFSGATDQQLRQIVGE